MSIASVIDKTGIAVITGGASGFGLKMAERFVKCGMDVAILDISQVELEKAALQLRSQAAKEQRVLAVVCDVTSSEDCKAARFKVVSEFPGRHISFLFNNAGIFGQSGSKTIEGNMDDWYSTMSVNVFGVVHIIKAFLPGMIDGGILPSGKKSYVVTTSSVVGLLNHNIGAYSVSKMACTAVCEQLALELQNMGPKAEHISPHSLHPTVGATNFLTGRGADGKMTRSEDLPRMLAKAGMTTAEQVIDGLFKGLEDRKSYVVVDHDLDIPTAQQVAMRMEDQISGGRPRPPQQLAGVLMMTDPAEFARRKQKHTAAPNSKF